MTFCGDRFTKSRFARLLAMGAAGLMLVAVSVAWWRRAPAKPSPTRSAAARPAAALARAKPGGPDYVGSQQCAKCHAAIAAAYAAHPMSHSSGRVTGPAQIERPRAAEFKPGDGRIYRVEKRGEDVFHHEVMVDRTGAELYDQAAKVDFFIGSGLGGRSYAIERGELLFESPITWYAGQGGRWDLSPGYFPGSHPRFERRIIEDCLLCHAGRIDVASDRLNTFVPPVLLEAAIGCERCHGPGKNHVDAQESGGPRQPDHSILNPAKLAAERRDAVCNQCHLQGRRRIARVGRDSGDFRPGDRLDDVWAVMVPSSGAGGQAKFVSQTEQMHQSACFRQSAGRFGCISCHDPHAQPAAEAAAAFYRDRCLRCHDEESCSAPKSERQAPPAAGSCVACHMPRLPTKDIAHMSQTDHRVPRRSDGDVDAIEQSDQAAGDLVIFDEEHGQMPRWEVDRANALAVAYSLQDGARPRPQQTRHAEAVLQDTLRKAPDDGDSLFALGALAVARHDLVLARTLWQRLLSKDADHEAALEATATVCEGLGNYQEALARLDRLAGVNPWRAATHARRAFLLAALGDLPKATDAAEKSLELDPTDLVTRQWLVRAYQRLNNAEASRRHADLLRRLTGN